MNFGTIKYCDIADGEGVRTTLFVSGCTHRCKGCFQPETWDFAYGQPFTPDVENEILESLAPSYIDGLTILGGEPMEPSNQAALVGFLEHVKSAYPNKTVWAYTGDVYEDLVDDESPRHTEVTERLLACIDVLVDGPFVEELKDISARFRGSSNQRIIDLAATREAGCVIEWVGDEVFSKRGQW